MAKEIERKFLVDVTRWRDVKKPEGQTLRQGYIVTDPNKTIRVRIAGSRGFLTIKGVTVGATRSEYEYEIPVRDAEELLDGFVVSELSKIRYTLLFKNRVWEVDEFLGDNAGLFVAEIELASENDVFDVPDWAGREVTGEERYYNSNLTKNPFKNWG